MSTIVQLGNYTFRRLAEEHGFTLTPDELLELEGLRTDEASFAAGTPKCHIFDIPRRIVSGTPEVQDRVLQILRGKTVHGEIQLAVRTA